MNFIQAIKKYFFPKKVKKVRYVLKSDNILDTVRRPLNLPNYQKEKIEKLIKRETGKDIDVTIEIYFI